MLSLFSNDTSSSLTMPLPLSLFCDEAVVSLDSNIPNYESDEESCVLKLLESELDQTHRSLLHGQIHKKTCFRTAREEAINWMLKVHAYYKFSPETAYLSVNYLDRFLLSHTLPQGKGWPMQLLSVACLALAAKMEETSVPLLLDLQMIDPRFLFRPKTVQKMELLVMASLKWRLRVITPFHFIRLFISKFSFSACPFGDLNQIMSRVSDVIIRTCTVMDFLEYPPSTIAAAAMVWVADDEKFGCIHKNISREMVQKCYKLMKQNVPRSEHVPKKPQALPPSPTCVLDHATMALNSLK